MIVFLQEEFVPAERACVSVFDRGFLYGDGAFETIRIAAGRPFRWEQHFRRLIAALVELRITAPLSSAQLESVAGELIQRNVQPEGVLRLAVSRGRGVRGYSPKGADSPTLVMSVHPLPQTDRSRGWDLVTSSRTLFSQDPLGRIKSANKLTSILARAEADAVGADEALLTDEHGFVVEGSGTNLFWWSKEGLESPALELGGLPGITRAAVLELCREQGTPHREARLRPAALAATAGVFLTNSGIDIVPARSVDGHGVPDSPRTRALMESFEKVLRQ